MYGNGAESRKEGRAPFVYGRSSMDRYLHILLLHLFIYFYNKHSFFFFFNTSEKTRNEDLLWGAASFFFIPAG